jgi:ribosomal protein L13
MRKSLNEHLDKIEKQTVEEMLSSEQKLQEQLKKVMVAMEIKSLRRRKCVQVQLRTVMNARRRMM